MKKTIIIIILLVLAIALFRTTSEPHSCSASKQDALFQVSTIDALLAGLYDGEITVTDIRKQGDLGLGTYNTLDGEMLVLDGIFYRIAADGKASVVKESEKSPFAVVTPFEVDSELQIGQDVDYDSLKRAIDAVLPTENIFYAFKITGQFRMVKTRSVPKQEPPYGPLIEIVKAQPVFDFENVNGTMVGFRCPVYVKGVNIPGYHLHFLTEDKTAGGHVLEFSIEDAVVSIDESAAFVLHLPSDDAFYKVDLSGNKEKELKKVER